MALEGLIGMRRSSSGGLRSSEALGLGRNIPRAVLPNCTLLALNPLDESRVIHMRHVASLAGRTAAWLGLGLDERRVIKRSALLHDFGKMVVPASILNKPARLSESEWRIVRRHPQIGADLLSHLGESRRVCEVVAAHHERWDGRGYPAGLAEQDIPIGARLIAVADAYDAMTSERPYREALSHEGAIERLELGSGNQFDPEVVEAVVAVLAKAPETPFGSLLQAMGGFTLVVP